MHSCVLFASISRNMKITCASDRAIHFFELKRSS